jgi:hypothetical protein
MDPNRPVEVTTVPEGDTPLTNEEGQHLRNVGELQPSDIEDLRRISEAGPEAIATYVAELLDEYIEVIETSSNYFGGSAEEEDRILRNVKVGTALLRGEDGTEEVYTNVNGQ